MLRTLLPLALIATAGASYAQTMSTPAPTTSAPSQTVTTPAQPMPSQTQTMPAPAPTTSTPHQTMTTPATPTQPMSAPSQTMSTGQGTMSGSAPGSVDANGRPIIGRNDWVRQPGDQPRPGTRSSNMDPNVATAPARPRASGAGQPGPDGTFRDEYGFRYDAQGNRIDARGRSMAPPVSRQ